MLDSSVTAGHTEADRQREREALDVMAELMPRAAALTRADVLTLLRQNNPDALIVDDDVGVSIHGLRFEFAGDRLVRIHAGG